MKVSEIIKHVAAECNQELKQSMVNGETVESFLLRSFNFYHPAFNARRRWPWLEKNGSLQTVANYEDGTVSVTVGSRTVTGTNTSWTSAMVGRVLKLDRDNEQYEILSVESGTSMTLKMAYIGATGSGLAYIIWKKYYSLDPDCEFGSEITFWQWPSQSSAMSKKVLNSIWFGTSYLNRLPDAWAWAGVDRTVSTYTASVTVSKNARTLTAASASFLDNVYAGTKVTIGTNSYNIESVDSNTQVTLVQRAVQAESGTQGTFETSKRSQVIFSGVPDPAINVYYSYPKRTYPLSNLVDDEPEIWSGFETVLLNIMRSDLLGRLTSDKEFTWLTIDEVKVKEVWRSVLEKQPNSIYFNSGS